jgi:hypothetical protein
MDLSDEIERELRHAHTASLEGNPGLSRVCARRAAGLAVRDYLVRYGYPEQTANNFELMKYPAHRKYLPASIHIALDHLTMTVNMDHQLPEGINLINDAKYVIETLIPGQKR